MKRETVKNIARFIGSFCVGGVTSLLVKQNILPKNLYEKIVVGIGTFVLSDMASTKAEDHIDKQIDNIFDTWDSIKLENNLSRKIIEIENQERTNSYFDTDGDVIIEMPATDGAE